MRQEVGHNLHIGHQTIIRTNSSISWISIELYDELIIDIKSFSFMTLHMKLWTIGKPHCDTTLDRLMRFKKSATIYHHQFHYVDEQNYLTSALYMSVYTYMMPKCVPLSTIYSWTDCVSVCVNNNVNDFQPKYFAGIPQYLTNCNESVIRVVVCNSKICSGLYYHDPVCLFYCCHLKKQGNLKKSLKWYHLFQ